MEPLPLPLVEERPVSPLGPPLHRERVDDGRVDNNNRRVDDGGQRGERLVRRGVRGRAAGVGHPRRAQRLVAGGLPRLELRTASRDVIDLHDGLLQGAISSLILPRGGERPLRVVSPQVARPRTPPQGPRLARPGARDGAHAGPFEAPAVRPDPRPSRRGGGGGAAATATAGRAGGAGRDDGDGPAAPLARRPARRQVLLPLLEPPQDVLLRRRRGLVVLVLLAPPPAAAAAGPVLVLL